MSERATCIICLKSVSLKKASRTKCACQYETHAACLLSYNATVTDAINPQTVVCLICKRHTGVEHDPRELRRYLAKLPTQARVAPHDENVRHLHGIDIRVPSLPSSILVQEVRLDNLPPPPEVRLR